MAHLIMLTLEMSLKECFMIMYLDCKHKVAVMLINAVEKDRKMVFVTFIYKALFVPKQFHSYKQEK